MKVSVIIPVFNGERSLARAVLSVISQSVQELEIIIINDGSYDQTLKVANGLAIKDNRIRVLSNTQNLGVSASRNVGLAEAKGEWIAILDADDAYHERRLEWILSVAGSTDIDIVFDNLSYYDWAADRVVGTAIRTINSGDIVIISIIDFLSNCITGRSLFDYGQLKFVVRNSFLKDKGISYMEDVRHGEDFLVYLECLLSGAKMVLIGEPSYIYTQRVGSHSRAASQMTRTIAALSEMRTQTLRLLQRPDVVGDQAINRLLLKRARAIRWHASWEKVYYRLHERRLVATLMIAISDWRIPPLLFEAAIKRLLRTILNEARL